MTKHSLAEIHTTVDELMERMDLLDDESIVSFLLVNFIYVIIQIVKVLCMWSYGQKINLFSIWQLSAILKICRILNFD